MKYTHILQAVAGVPWAIHPDKGRAVVEFLVSKALGAEKTPEEIQAAKKLAREPVRQTEQQSIAILPVSSVILPRAHDIKESSQGANGQSSEQLSRQIQELVARDDISAIVLDIDSPGGAVSGVPELFEAVYSMRGAKRIIAVANHFAASAAYWLACAADEIVMTPSGMVGSVGVYSYHEDISQRLESHGVKPTYISSSDQKVEGAREFALSDEARSHLQAIVDTYASQFIRDVAKGRGVSEIEVRQKFGNGRMYQAEYAISAGMVDRVATLDQVISELKSEVMQKNRKMDAYRRRLALAG